MAKTKFRKRKNKNNFFNFSFISGLFFGFFLSFTIFIWKDEISLPFKNIEKPTVNQPKSVEPLKPPVSKQADKLSPTFYKFLSTEKVPVPHGANKEQQNNTIPEVGADNFYLQIGSFKNLADADARKAQLALLGITTRIKETANREGGKWYRVQLGPVSRASARELRKKISKEGLEVLVTKN